MCSYVAFFVCLISVLVSEHLPILDVIRKEIQEGFGKLQVRDQESQGGFSRVSERAKQSVLRKFNMLTRRVLLTVARSEEPNAKFVWSDLKEDSPIQRFNYMKFIRDYLPLPESYTWLDANV